MISFTLSTASHIHVAIYDLHGRRVHTLVDDVRASGRHIVHWPGTNAVGQTLASGIYFCRMTAENGFSTSQKMLMVK
jgi:flagellar hook assembly protein FlgD